MLYSAYEVDVYSPLSAHLGLKEITAAILWKLVKFALFFRVMRLVDNRGVQLVFNICINVTRYIRNFVQYNYL